LQVKRRDRMFAHLLDLLEVGKHIRRLWRPKLPPKGGKRNQDLDIGLVYSEHTDGCFVLCHFSEFINCSFIALFT
jgi:hypothetical protein